MEIVLGFILLVFVVGGILILAKVNKKEYHNQSGKEEFKIPVSDCCGAHEVCEFDQIKADENRIEYYDDEELDAFKNIPENGYSNSEIDQFREVLYTLKTHEIRYWLLSIERRKINLPGILVSEARTLMAEAKS